MNNDGNAGFSIVLNENVTYKINAFPDTIYLDRRGIEIQFYNKIYNSKRKKFYACQLAVFDNDKVFNQIEIGKNKNDLPCYSMGSGMAAEETGYESFFVNNYGHHYLYYENDSNSRINLLQKGKPYNKYGFVINKLTINGIMQEITRSPIGTLFVSMFVDRNLNNIIEEGELGKAVLLFSIF